MDKNTKKEESMKAVLEAFNKKFAEPADGTFTSGGRAYPLTCTDDCLVADAQRVAHAAKTVLEEVRKEDNYHKEQAAARLFGLLEAQEKLSCRFAEIHQSYPESAAMLMEQIPTLKALAHAGAEVWEKINDKA